MGAARVSIEVTLILGVLAFAAVRGLSVWWPRHPSVRTAAWNLVFLTVLGRAFVIVIAILAALDAVTHVTVAEHVVLALWPILAIAVGLEIVWRSAREFLGPVEIVRAPRTPWTHGAQHGPRTPKGQVQPQSTPRTGADRQPSVAVAGHEQRVHASRPVPRAPAAILSPQPLRAVGAAQAALPTLSPQPSERVRAAMRLHGPISLSQGVPAQVRFKRNVALLLAQLVAITQGVLGIIDGVHALHGKNGASSAATIVIGVAVIIAAVAVVRPSHAARSLLVLWELIAMLFTIGVLLHAHDVAPLLVSAAGMGVAQPLVALALELVVLYGLLLHPATRVAFAR